MITHGLGLLLVLVAGFGMLAKLGIHGVPTWAALKLIIWVALGAFAALAYKENMAGNSIFEIEHLQTSIPIRHSYSSRSGYSVMVGANE
jgi:hypothetical protein